MEVYETLQKRKSTRSYDARSIPDDVLGRVLEAGRIAPSAVNYQPWHFIVVKEQERRDILSKAPFARFLKESPVVIVGCGDSRKSPKWHVVDVAIAMQQIVIAATSEGLGTCWIGSFYEDKVRNLLKIPDRYRVVALLAVGYPKEKSSILGKLKRSTSRKDLSEIVSMEEFGQAMKN
ncbi:MAG: nitroreductase family protein [Thermoplasmata archaeon]|nr:nitroreductase family protein [Thermoplasmata archaeon]